MVVSHFSVYPGVNWHRFETSLSWKNLSLGLLMGLSHFFVCLPMAVILISRPIYPLISQVWSSYVIISQKTVKAMADGPCMDDNHDDLPTKMMVMFHGCAKEHPKKRPNCWSTPLASMISRRLSFSRSMAFSSSPSRLGRGETSRGSQFVPHEWKNMKTIEN